MRRLLPVSTDREENAIAADETLTPTQKIMKMIEVRREAAERCRELPESRQIDLFGELA